MPKAIGFHSLGDGRGDVVEEHGGGADILKTMESSQQQPTDVEMYNCQSRTILNLKK